MIRALSIAAALVLVASSSAAAAPDAPDYLAWAQPGPYLTPAWTDFGVSSFGSRQAIVGGYFFYWFDAEFLRSQQPTRAFDPFPVHASDQDTQSFHEVR